ncbi:hypothetical protein ACHAPQ_007121 [Fusarium lateritium]
MAPSNNGDTTVSHLPEPTDAVDRLRPPSGSHYTSIGASFVGNGNQYNGNNETYNYNTNVAVQYHIHYNSTIDPPTQSYEPIRLPERSCEQYKDLQEQCKALREQSETLREQSEALREQFEIHRRLLDAFLLRVSSYSGTSVG